MMASIADQRRFLATIQTVTLKKLLQIKTDLESLREPTEQDKRFLDAIRAELSARD